MKTQISDNHCKSAATLLEALIVVAILGTLATLIYTSTSDMRRTSKGLARVQDVKQLNNAVRVYTAAGGSLKGVSDPHEVLERLKSTVSDDQRKALVGFRGKAVDARLTAIEAKPGAGGESGVVWNEELQRFQIVDSPVSDDQIFIDRFGIGEASEPAIIGRKETVSFARKDNWVWDYSKADEIQTNGPDDLQQRIVPVLVPHIQQPMQSLLPPVFSLQGGKYPLSYFDGKFVTVGNPNGSIVSETVTTGSPNSNDSIKVPLVPGLKVSAYSKALDQKTHFDSELISHTYTVDPADLLVDVTSTKDRFNYFEAGGMLKPGSSTPSGTGHNLQVGVVAGTDIPLSFHSSNYYRFAWTLDGSDPVTSASRWDYGDFSQIVPQVSIEVSTSLWPGSETTATVSAATVDADPVFFANGPGVSKTISVEPLALEGPLILKDKDKVTLELDLSSGNVPDSAYIIYTIKGKDAKDSDWKEYKKEFKMKKGDLLIARTVVPSGIEKWFIPGISPKGEPDAYSPLGDGHFDLDTSTEIASIGNGKTNGHVHNFNEKYNTIGADFMNLPDKNLDSVSDVIPAGTRFKIIVANGDLSPGARVFVNQVPFGEKKTGGVYVNVYDDHPIEDMPTYSLEGLPGTVKLESFAVYLDENILNNAGLVPSNTGEVKSNVPGPNGEWRNGALTFQIVEVNADGSPAFTTSLAMSRGGVQGVATTGLLWESTLFWHWKGPSMHENSPFVPNDPSSVVDYLEDK